MLVMTGFVRKCSAGSPESCRATKGDMREHFSIIEDAEKSYEKKMSGVLFKPSRKNDNLESFVVNGCDGVGEIFLVEDNGGGSDDMVGGVLNKDSEYLFNNGQCLALATQLSKDFGTNRVAVIWDEEDSDEWDDDNDGPLKQNIPFHVLAVDEDNKLWDVSGRWDDESVSSLVDKHGSFSYLNVDDSYDYVAGFLPEQNYEFAESFVDVVKGRGDINFSVL